MTRKAVDNPKRSGKDRRGLECARCGCRHFDVIYTRRSPGAKIIRRRECRNCGRRITTYEKEITR